MKQVQSIHIYIVLAYLLTGLSACLTTRGATTAEEAGWRAAGEVERLFPWQRTAAEVHGTRQTPWGVLVLYARGKPDLDPPRVPYQMGFVLTEQRGDAWQRNGALRQTDVIPHPDALIDYRADSIPLVKARHALVFGRVRAPQVAAVEATFDDGQTVRDAVTGEMFAVIAPGATAVCTVRVIKAQGGLLQELDPIREQPAFTGEEQARRQATCST